MKLCFDTNVAIDIAQKNERFLHAFASLDIAIQKGYDMLLPVQSLPDIPYILHRRGLTREQAMKETASLLDLFVVMDETDSDARFALQSEMTDFEDALIAQAALRNGVDFIITNNVKDFAASPVPVLSPEKFTLLYSPEGIVYEEIEW